MCGVPPYQYTFLLCCVPPNVVLCLSHTHVFLGFYVRTSEHIFMCGVPHLMYFCALAYAYHTDTWLQLKYQSSPNCILECGTPSSACFLVVFVPFLIIEWSESSLVFCISSGISRHTFRVPLTCPIVRCSGTFSKIVRPPLIPTRDIVHRQRRTIGPKYVKKSRIFAFLRFFRHWFRVLRLC